ncbi:MAG TPA: heme-binding protein [Rhizomicrobium sp.]|jgi:uncharacterized protein GlcG (DUF336 family)
MSGMTLERASQIIPAVLKKGRQLGLKPLSVAVLDACGHLIAFQRQDGSSIMRFQIAYGKAFGALALGVSSRKIGEMAAERPNFVASLGAIAPYGVIPAAGGVIIMDQGVIMGAVGVTGDTSDNDELCALSGIAAANMEAQP